MITTNRPLVYFENKADFNTEYDNTVSNEMRDKQAVFVGDTREIYTHGVRFDCNNTTYNQATGDTLGLIKIGYIQTGKNYPVELDANGKAYVTVNWTDSDTVYDDTAVRGLISTNSQFLTGLENRLNNIYDEVQQNVQNDIDTILQDAEWLKDHFPAGEVFGFGDLEQDVKEYLIGLGLIEEYEDNGETKTRVGWSSLQLQYDNLLARVAAVEQGEVDQEALEAALKLYIDGEVGSAEARLDTKYALTDAEGRALEWLSSGFSSASNQYETFANMYSAAMTDYGTAISGVSTRVQTLENAGYVTSASVGTMVANEVNTAVSGMDSRITATENSISAMSEFGSRISSLESGQSDIASGLSTVTSTANGNATAIANMFATNGAGTAAISTYVTDWWSGVTISGDKVDLTGRQLNMAFGQTAEEYESVGPLLSINENSFEIKNVSGYYNNNSVEIRPYALWVQKVTDSEMPSAQDRLVEILPNKISVNHWERSVGWTPYAYVDEEGFHGDVSCDYIHLNHELQIAANENARIEFETGIQLGNIFNQDENNPGYYDGLYMKNSSGRYETLITSSGIAIDDNTNDNHTWIYPNIITTPQLSQTSDRNLKDIISDVNLTVEQVAEAPAVEFTWKKDQSEDKQHNVGTIAQYWQVVLPEVVGEDKNGNLTMQYSNAAMISAIVTAKEVVALKEEIAELKRQIAELKNN